MRIRQIKPSWWLDKDLRKGLTAEQREFYIGLWQLADDRGWIEWDPVRIGAELYPYDPISRRERNVATWATALAGVDPEAPHFVRFTCGHAQVPKMPGHQRIAGKLTTTVEDKHVKCKVSSQCEPALAEVGSGIGRVGKGTERGGAEGSATTTGGSSRPVPRSEFSDRVPRPPA